MPPRYSREITRPVVLGAQLKEQFRTSPCETSCPIGNSIQKMNSLIEKGQFTEALRYLRAKNPFPGITGRVCPHFCMDACNRKEMDGCLNIRALERAAETFAERGNVFFKRRPATGKKAAVIGGGPAGMQAAITAAECGHTVELFEKNCALGGEVLAAGADSMKVDVRRYKDWLIGELRDNKVPVHLNTLITADEVQIRGFDTVILATGAESVAPASIKGINKAVSALDVLEGKVSTGKKVLVAGGGQIGCETAVALARDGYEVSLLEAMPSVMDVMFVPKQPKMMLKAMLEQYKVNMLTGMKLLEVNEKGALIQKTDGSTEPEQLECDTTVLAIGLRPVNALAESFRGRNITIYQIGSARRVGDIFGAVHDAFEVVYNMD